MHRIPLAKIDCITPSTAKSNAVPLYLRQTLWYVSGATYTQEAKETCTGVDVEKKQKQY